MSTSYADLFAKFLSGAPAPGTTVQTYAGGPTSPNDTFRGTLVPGTTGMYQGATQNFGYGVGQGSQSVTGTRGSNIYGYDPSTNRLYVNFRFLTDKPRVVTGLWDVTTQQWVVNPADAGLIAGTSTSDTQGQGGWMQYPYLSGSNINTSFQLPGRLDPSHQYTLQVALPQEGGVGSDINDPATHPQVSGAALMGLSPPPSPQTGQVGQQAQTGTGNFPATWSQMLGQMSTPGGLNLGTLANYSAQPFTYQGQGTQVYQTVNGPRTVAQMAAELQSPAVRWDGDPNNAQAVIDAYQRTAGGGTGQVTPISNINPGGGVGTVPQFNADQFKANLDQAATNAEIAYKQGIINHYKDSDALAAATQAFKETIDAAGLTGVFQGQQTLAAQKQFADMLGTYQGQQTLEAQKQAAEMLGMYQGQTTLAAQKQYFDQAFQQQQQNQKAVQDYLTLLSQLRGPADYGQYLKVQASTPQGLTSLAQAAAGAGGRVPSFGYTGAGTSPVTPSTLVGGAAGGTAGGTTPAAGGTTPASTTYADYTAATQGLPAPSSIAPQNWNAMTDTQRQLLLGMYEAAGWNTTDVQKQYAASLPKFGMTNAATTGSTRLV